MKSLSDKIILIIIFSGIFFTRCGNYKGIVEKKSFNYTDETTVPVYNKTDTFEKYKKSGILKTEVEDFKGAVEDMTIALNLNPEVVSLYFYRGHSNYKLNRYNEAISDFTKAIERQPNGIYYNSRGIAKDASGDYYGALKDFNKAIEMVPGDAEFYYYRGITKRHLNDKKGACLDWKISDESGYDDALEQLNKYCK
ncbi:MAG: tetratricopeptide repeat protein [Chitinophagales bacterium]